MDKYIDEYRDQADWRVKENSNTIFSIGGLKNLLAETAIAKHSLNMLPNSISQLHKDHFLHIHDLGNFSMPYCAGWSTKDILLKGLQVDTRFPSSEPAKHLGTALEHILNHCFLLTQEFSGAQAYSSLDIYLAPFIKEDKLTYKEVKQQIQRLIFALSQKYRTGLQSPFSNITLDLSPLGEMKTDNVIVGGKELDYTYSECQKEIDMFNKAFCEVMGAGDGMGKPFSFPIPTYSITKDFDWNSEISDYLFDMTVKSGIPYFSNFVNSSLDPNDVRSMCPLTGDTKVLVKTSKGIMNKSIVSIVNTMKQHNTEYEVFYKGEWSKAEPVRVPMTKVFKLTMSNGDIIKMGESHLQPTLDNKTLMASELKEGMFLPYNSDELGSDLGSYDIGYVVGAFAGDGSYDRKCLVYSLDKKEKDDETEEILTRVWKGLGCSVTSTLKKAVRSIYIGVGGRDLVERYIENDNALTKSLSKNVFNSSIEFKEGLLAGFRATDEARDKNRLYTSSIDLRDGLKTVLASLGRKGLSNYIDTRDGRLGTNPNYRIDYPNRDKYGSLYTSDDNFNYFSITKIEEVQSLSKELYCFEVDNVDSRFTLSNGLVTHNCRLRLDKKELVNNGGGLFGAGELTGSVGVVTLNMGRLSYIAQNPLVENVVELLKDYPKRFLNKFKSLMTVRERFEFLISYSMDKGAKSLVIKRDLNEENFALGLFPYTKAYLGDYSNHFNTIGLIGMNEAMQNLGHESILDKEAKDYSEFILDFMLEKLKEYQVEYGDYYTEKYGYSKGLLFNLEASPGEGAGYKLARYDRELFGDDISLASNDLDSEPYYTNSTQVPQNHEINSNLFSVLDHQDSLQSKYTSGTVFHIYTEGKLTKEKGKGLIRKACENYTIPYFSLSPTITVCPIHGRLDKEYDFCPFDHTEEELDYIKKMGGMIITTQEGE
jgi:anaerobic ribonucleoside-triphosphate reductase